MISRRLTSLVVVLSVALVSMLSFAPKAAFAIIGGNIKEGDTSPYVSMHTGQDYNGKTTYSTPYCSGTLIGARWVLSAAHCFAGSGHGSWYDVVMVTTASGTRIPYVVAKITVHPLYYTSPEYDLAVLELQTPIAEASYLPYGGYAESTLKSLSTFATGWGMSVENTPNGEGSTAVSVMSVQTPVHSARAQSIGANRAGVGSVCFGDSGGSLTALDPRFAQPVLVGVLWAFSLDAAEFCNIKNSFYSVNLGYVSSWIQEVSSISPAVTVPIVRDIIKDFGKGNVPPKIYGKQSKTICSSPWVASRQAEFAASLAQALAGNLVSRHPSYLPPAYYPDALIPVVLGGGFDHSNLAWFSMDPSAPSAKSDRVAFGADLNKQVCSGKINLNRALALYRQYLAKQ